VNSEAELGPAELRYYAVRAPHLSPKAALAVNVIATAIFTAVALTVSEPVALAFGGVVLAACLLANELGRLVFLVEGGLLTLHSGVNGLTEAKAAYAGGIALSVAAIVVRIRRRHSRRRDAITQLGPGTIAFAAMIVLSAPVASSHGATMGAWFRDATPYALLAVIPLFAWDAGQERLSGWLGSLLAGAGLASALAFVVEWLARRHVVATAPQDFILPSLLLPAAATSFGLALLTSRSRFRRWWLVFVLLVVPGMFLAGTRSALIILAAGPVVLWLSRGLAQTRRTAVVATLSLVATAALAISIAYVVPISDSSPVGRVASRLRELPHLAVKPASDQSYVLRRGQWRVAWESFTAHPFAGVGPGHVFTSPYNFGGQSVRRTSSLDTPVAFLAKFGVVGLLATLVLGMGWWRLGASLLKSGSPSAIALAAFGAVALLYVPLGVPFEDKGFTIGLLLIAALGLAHGNNRVLPPAIAKYEWRGAAPAGPRRPVSAHSETPGVPPAQLPRTHRGSAEEASPPAGLLSATEVRGVLFTLIGILVGAAIVAGIWSWRGGADEGSASAVRTVTVARSRSVSPSSAADAHRKRREAAAYVRIWTFFSCAHCKFTLKPIAGPMWEFDIASSAGQACYMLDTERFRWSSTRVQAGVARLSCP
jgi:hypothetical protein